MLPEKAAEIYFQNSQQLILKDINRGKQRLEYLQKISYNIDKGIIGGYMQNAIIERISLIGGGAD